MVRLDSNNADGYGVSVLLQKGVFVERAGASSVMEFVCKLLNLTSDAVAADVKTIMADNSVVDDPASSPIQNVETLVLSGAMPGLVGAMLRSDSPYKAMRATITSTGEGRVDADTSMIKVKLFNMVLKKYTKRMLEHGFWIENDGS